MIKAIIKKDGSVSIKIKGGCTNVEIITMLVMLTEKLVDAALNVVGETYDERYKTACVFSTAFDRSMEKFKAMLFNSAMQQASEMDIEINLDDLDEIRRQMQDMDDDDG